MKIFFKYLGVMLINLFFVVGVYSKEMSPIVIQIGYENHPGEPLDLAVNKWKKIVEEKSKGKMKIEIFPSSQLGSKNDIIDQMLAGDSVITLADGAFYAERGVPDLGITFGPYLFNNWEECWKLTNSNWWKNNLKKLEEKGLKVLTSNWEYGDRHILSKRPVRNIEDLKGLKIRVPNNIIQVRGLAELGATSTPMPLGDVYTSLQQGTIDGLENPLTVLYNGKFHEVAKYLTLTGHVKNFTTWVCGSEFFNSLTTQQQNILIESGNEAGLYNNTLQNKLNEEIIMKYKEEGVEIIKIDQNIFAEKAKSFYELPEIKSKWSKDLYEEVKKSMKE